MTDSDTKVGTETWKPIPGYPAYEASDCGRIRSIPRTEHGRTYRSVVLSTRVGNRGYALVNLRNAEGKTETRTVHTLLLLAHREPRRRGQVARHLNDDPLDNRLENLVWGTPEENEADKVANGGRVPAAPKPERHCARCGDVLPAGRGGKRCHACVTEIGEEAAKLLTAGVSLEEAGKRLGYPHLSGLHQLARTYGGYGAPPAQPSPSVTERRGTLATLRDRLRRVAR